MTRPDDAEPGLADEVARLLADTNLLLGRHFAVHAAAVGLSAIEGKVLLAVAPGEARSMRAIADALGYDPSNLTGVVDRLEDRGALTRQPDSTDRRIKTLVATRKGVDLGQRLNDRLLGDAGPLLTLTPVQLRRLRDLLDPIVRGGASS